jgi:two-component system, sensor histidine kinase and response regulator
LTTLVTPYPRGGGTFFSRAPSAQLRVNQALCQIVGYPADELLAIGTISRADVAQAELMGGGKIDTYNVEKRYLRKDGSIVWGRKTVSCVRKGDASIEYFVSGSGYFYAERS